MAMPSILLGLAVCLPSASVSCMVFMALYIYTSSSAVAKRPRDASCVSVVSFDSTKRRVFYCYS